MVFAAPPYCHCGIRNRYCNLWKWCPYCAYRQKLRLLDRFLPKFHHGHWFFLTLRFTGDLILDETNTDDIPAYWDACVCAVRQMVQDGIADGAVRSEELHVECLLPLLMLPHCHVVFQADDFRADQRQRQRQHRACIQELLAECRRQDNFEDLSQRTISGRSP